MNSSLERRSQCFKGGRAQSGPLTALIGYLNVLLEYFNFFKFSLAGHNQHLGGPGPAFGYTPACKPASCSNNEIRYN